MQLVPTVVRRWAELAPFDAMYNARVISPKKRAAKGKRRSVTARERCIATAGTVGLVVGWPAKRANSKRDAGKIAAEALKEFDKLPVRQRRGALRDMLLDTAKMAKEAAALHQLAGRRR